MGEIVAVSDVATPIGKLRLAASQKGLVRLSLPIDGGRGFVGWIARYLPGAESVPRLPHLDRIERELVEYFEGTRTEFGVPLDLRGTGFQLSVWHAVSSVSYGETRTYGEIAASVGRPKAFRAVGAANGANPVPIVVPCHRIVAVGGKLGGYGGGLPTKRRLLAFESAHSPTLS